MSTAIAAELERGVLRVDGQSDPKRQATVRDKAAAALAFCVKHDVQPSTLEAMRYGRLPRVALDEEDFRRLFANRPIRRENTDKFFVHRVETGGVMVEWWQQKPRCAGPVEEITL